MLNSTQNTDLILNGIEQVKTICLALMDDLDFYQKRPNPNRAYIDIKQKQIDQLFNVCQTFTTVYNNIENAFIDVNIQHQELEDKIFKLEACLVYHGLSLAEIHTFTNRPSERLAQDLKQCMAERWRQIPLFFKPLLLYYEAKEVPQYKTGTEPVYDLKASLKQFKNSQN
jgi:hypothetical protein